MLVLSFITLALAAFAIAAPHRAHIEFRAMGQGISSPKLSDDTNVKPQRIHARVGYQQDLPRSGVVTPLASGEGIRNGRLQQRAPKGARLHSRVIGVLLTGVTAVSTALGLISKLKPGGGLSKFLNNNILGKGIKLFGFI